MNVKLIRRLINNGDYDFVPRRKNLESLINLNLDLDDIKSTLKNLSVENFIEKRKNDQRKGYVYIYKKAINNNVIYIKIAIEYVNKRQIVKIISFHEDEKRKVK